MKLIITLLLSLFVAGTSLAEDYKHKISEPVDVSLAGWNKVLIMPNGNTLFFHFEVRKGIVVKIFDKARKESISLKHIPKVLDINVLDRSALKAMFSIKDEVAIFITQMLDNKETLIRIRIDGTTGKLLGEDKIVQSQSFQKRLKAYVVKHRSAEDYYILTCKEKAGFTEKEINLLTYDATHTVIKETSMALDQKGADDVVLHSLTIDDNGGVFATVELNKIIQYPDRWERNLFLAYKPSTFDKFIFSKVSLPASFEDYSVFERFNLFAKNLNVLLSVTHSGLRGNDAVSYKEQSLLLMNEDLSNGRYLVLNNKKVKDYIKAQIDTTQEFSGIVLHIRTAKNGVTTVIYEGKTQTKELFGRYRVPGTRKNFAITQFDDDGNEMFGTVLPKSSLTTSENSYPSALGRSSIREIYGEEILNTKNNFYLLYNDVQSNFDHTLASSSDSLYDREESEAIVYHFNRKREVSKSYLFGKSTDGGYKHLYTDSGDLKEETGEYATVFQHKQGKKAETKIAWVHFEP